MATSKAVAKKENTELSVLDISLFEADAGAGNENMGAEDLALPFLKILSGLDPVLDQNEEARKGDIYNTVSGQIYKGKEGIKVIPCAYQRRFIEWEPRGKGNGAPLNIYAPGEAIPDTERSPDDNKDYVVGGEGQYIEETHQHFVLLLNEDGGAETALIAMKSTQLKKSRKWNSMIASTTLQGSSGYSFVPPRYSHIYELKTIQEENSKGSWHGWEMSRVGLIEDAALYGQAKAFSESVSAGDVNVKHSDDEEKQDIPF
jgi:hypothetical protein